MKFSFLIFIVLPAFLQAQPIQLKNETDYSLLYRERSQDVNYDLHVFSNLFSGTFPVSGSPLSVSWLRTDRLYSYSKLSAQTKVKLSSRSDVWEFKYPIAFQSIIFTPSIELTSAFSEVKAGYGGKLLWGFSEQNSLSALVFKRNDAYGHDWKIRDVSANFKQVTSIWEYSLQGKLALGKVAIISSEFGKRSYKNNPVESTFKEKATWENQSGKLRIEFPGKSQISGWITGNLFQGTGLPEWTYQSSPFTSLESGKLNDWSVSGGMNFDFSKNWTVTSIVSYRDFNLKSGGLIQSFPFTPAVVSLLGDYYFFRIDGSAIVSTLSGGVNYKNPSGWNVGVESGWMKVVPELTIQTWEPLFLLIGRKKERITQFSYRQIDLIPFTIKGEIKIYDLLAGIKISQLIPVSAKKQNKTSTGSGGSGSGSGSTGSPKTNKTVWGGTEVKITVNYTL